MPEIIQNLLNGFSSLGVLWQPPREYMEWPADGFAQDRRALRSDVVRVAKDMTVAVKKVKHEILESSGTSDKRNTSY